MYCRNCGQQMDEGKKICPSCGAHQGTSGSGIQQASKSRLVIGLIGIFLGTLGIHNFILGHNGRGLAQLLISTLTCGIGAAVVWVWALIESIQILTGEVTHDAYGNPLTD